MQQPRRHPLVVLLATVALVAGPVAAIAARLFDPATSPTESIARLVADAAAHPGETHAVLVGDAFIWLMLPAALVAAGLAWRRAPALATAAGVLSLVGWTGIVALATQDALIAEAGHARFARGPAVTLATAWSNGGVVNTYTTMFVVGHLLGTILLGAALWRARVIPRGLAAGVAVAMPLHLLAFVTGVKPLDLASDVLLLIGFGACALSVLRETAAGSRTEEATGLAVA